MKKPKMVLYVGLGGLAAILIWSIFRGSRDTAETVDVSHPAGDAFLEDKASAAVETEGVLIEEDILMETEAEVTEETLIDEGIIVEAAGSESEKLPVEEEITDEALEDDLEESMVEIAVAEEPVVEIPAAAELPAVQPSPREERFHTVVRGDTLWAISRTYGVTPRAIQEANSIRDPGHILIGQKLKIP